MMWYVARAAIERGISPDSLRRHHAGHENTRWVSVHGMHDLSSFCAQADRESGRKESVTRRFHLKEDDDLFFFQGQTWALTTQWGDGTGDTARSFGRAFPILELHLIEDADNQSHVAARPQQRQANELFDEAERIQRERLQLERDSRELEQERLALETARRRLREPRDERIDADRGRPTLHEHELPEWLRLIPDPARRVFHHIAEHGAVNEEEATRILGGARHFRQFSREFETYRSCCPFRVRIEMAGLIKSYVRHE